MRPNITLSSIRRTEFTTCKEPGTCLHLTMSVAQSKENPSITCCLILCSNTSCFALWSILHAVLHNIFYIIFIENTCNLATIPTLKGYTLSWPVSSCWMPSGTQRKHTSEDLCRTCYSCHSQIGETRDLLVTQSWFMHLFTQQLRLLCMFMLTSNQHLLCTRHWIKSINVLIKVS